MATSAVITGDIVASTRLPKPVLNKLLKKITAVLAPYPHEFFRGDSFQAFIKSADEAYAVLLRLRLEALVLEAGTAAPASDIRASIGIGQVRPPVNTIRTATDEAFVLSGRLFEQLRTAHRLLIATPEKNTVVNTGLHVLASFTDFIFERMTSKQAAVVKELLQQKTQVEVAKTLKKSQATIHQHAQAAGWPALEKLTADYKRLIGAITL